MPDTIQIIRSNKIPVLVLIGLLSFLSISAWLISLSGIIWLTLIRDVLVIVLGILALPRLWKQPSWLVKTVFIFSTFALLSVIWRDASLAQWAKGYRFTILPLIFFAALSTFRFNPAQERKISWLLWGLGIGIAFLAILQLAGVEIPVVTNASHLGALISPNKVGELNIYRVQSILAGPNALGLTMLVLLAANAGIIRQYLPRYLTYLSAVLLSIALIGSYSRSSWLGLGLIVFYLVGNTLYKKLRSKRRVVFILFGWLLTIAIGGYYLSIKNPTIREFITHGSSSSVRIEQYQRIWDNKFQIGFFGQGTGSAGPASQYRLDDGINQFTENMYLDLFQELGLIGLVLYLIFLASVWREIQKMPLVPQSLLIKALFISFLTIGLFINTHTGQVAIYLFWTLIGLGLMNATIPLRSQDG